jgi:hypothetical protein
MTTAQLWLARVEIGIPPKVCPIATEMVRMPGAQWSKSRAKIMDRQPEAWVFSAPNTRTPFSPSRRTGAAATDYSPAAAIASALRVLAQHEAAKASR